MNNPYKNLTKDQLIQLFGVTIPSAFIVSYIPKIYKRIVDKKISITKDKLLDSRNKKINLLYDKYKEGKGVSGTKDEVKKYYDALNDILSDTLNYSKYIKDEKNERTIFSTVIAPFLVFIQSIVTRDIYILAGTDTGADRRNFEIVFEPDPLKALDVSKNPYRTKLYEHKWPDHGFRVSTASGIGVKDANELISDTLWFLASNPKYMSIRV